MLQRVIVCDPNQPQHPNPNPRTPPTDILSRDWLTTVIDPGWWMVQQPCSFRSPLQDYERTFSQPPRC